jgi:hypothetical protein
LGGEPESFQLEKMGPNIYVNVPDLKQIVGSQSNHEGNQALVLERRGAQLPDGA